MASPGISVMTRVSGSMDISIARSPRDDVRQPRVRQLEFGGMNRRRHRLSPGIRGEPTRAEPFGNILQRMPRFDLRATSLVRVLSDAPHVHRARVRPCNLQPIEARLIDRFEWKLRLKSGDRGRIELAGRLQGA